MSTAREFFESTLPAKLTPDSAAAIGAHFQFNITVEAARGQLI